MDKSRVQLRSLFAALITIGCVLSAAPVQGQQVVATVQLPSGVQPTSFALDASDNVLYVGANTTAGKGAVYAIFLANASTIGSAALPGEPNYSNALAYSPATGQLYALSLTATGTDTSVTQVIAINTKANPITSATLNVLGNPGAISLNQSTAKSSRLTLTARA